MDLDGDGRTDVISGSWPGEIYFFRRLADGTFAAGVPLKHAGGKVVNVGRRSAAFAVDWDGDGKLALLLGDRCGGFEGRPTLPAGEKVEESSARALLPGLRKEWAETFRAYRKAKGQDEVPSRDYLFDAQNNIELGTAYLNVLTYDQLDRVGSAVSREYCVISAYNTGPRNVFRAFAHDPVAAVNQINSLQPPAVYEKLRHSLPYQETRQYLDKVVTFRKEFVTSSEGAR